MDPEPKPPQSPHHEAPKQQPSPAPSMSSKRDLLEASCPIRTFTIRGDSPSDGEGQDTSGKPHTNTIATANSEAKGAESLVGQQLAKSKPNAPQKRTVRPSAESSKEPDVEQKVSNILKPALSQEAKPGNAHSSVKQENLDDEDNSRQLVDGATSDHEKNPGHEDGSDHEDDSDYEDGNDSSYSRDEDDGDQKTKRNPSKKANANKPRRKRAANAREFVARLHEKEDRAKGEKRGQKRKSTDCDGESRKAHKLAKYSSASKFDDGPSTTVGNSLAAMEPIQANTIAEQFAQIRAQIPQNYDTRRSKTQKRDLREATQLFGYKKVEAENGRWRMKGMEAVLESYQLTAAAWMVKRELSQEKPFGGLLADRPGMGKTVMSLACIVGNPADEQDLANYCNATLVVVPNKLTGQQWEQEVQKHCKSPVSDKVFIYDSTYEGAYEKCKSSFIVITTYSQLLAQYPDKSIIQYWQEKYDSDEESFDRAFASKAGDLFNIPWYRVILDEAHAIKNVDSRTAQACSDLRSKYRWALSGTPLANSSYELYPYLKFIQCKATWSMRDFKETYISEGKVNGQLEALISMVMYRRTSKDEFLGHKILDLPEMRESYLVVPLSVEERLIVTAVESFYKRKIRNLEQGTLEKEELEVAIDGLDVDEPDDDKKRGRGKAKNASMTWMLTRASLMRKRQAISHPFCIERLLRHSLEPQELAELIEALKQVPTKQTIIEQIRANDRTDDGIAAFEKGLQILQQREEPMFGKYFDMGKLLGLAKNERALSGITCLLCNKATPPVEPFEAHDCGHVFCSTCLLKAISRSKKSREMLRCPYEECGKEITGGDEIETLQSQIDSKDKNYREPGRDSNNSGVHHQEDRNGFFLYSTMPGDASVVPSTRLTATMAIVLTWLKEAPNDKILIFTQFTGTAKVLGYMLQTLDIKFVHFYGGLAPGQKKKAVDSIKMNPDIKVMVSTLKSGGQSLNLTAANRVIIVDPWWNKTAERQAFGRVTRMGQEKKTHLVKIRTEEEIDERIFMLQKRKAEDVDYTLQDDGHTPPAVSDTELQETFFRKKSDKKEKKKNRKKKSTATKKK